MKVDREFPLHVALTFVIGLVMASLVSADQRSEVVHAVIGGAILSTLNVIAGFLAIEFSIGKSNATFLKAVLGGMGIRLGLMLVLLVVLVRFAGLHATALVVSVLCFYVVYLILEIIYIQKKVSYRHK